MKPKVIYSLSKWLSVFGIVLASYLLIQYYNLIPGSEVACNLNSTFNCNAMITGSLATLFGVPVAWVGLIGYVVILVSAIIKNKKLFLIMSLFGTLFCLRITILELFFVQIICPVCLLCQLVMIILSVLAIFVNYPKKKKKN